MEVLQQQHSKVGIIDTHTHTLTHTHTHTHTHTLIHSLTPDSTDLAAAGGPKFTWGKQNVQ